MSSDLKARGEGMLAVIVKIREKRAEQDKLLAELEAHALWAALHGIHAPDIVSISQAGHTRKYEAIYKVVLTHPQAPRKFRGPAMPVELGCTPDMIRELRVHLPTD